GRRRRRQAAYNKDHGITPSSIKKNITDILGSIYEADYVALPIIAEKKEGYLSPEELILKLKRLEKQMKRFAKEYRFEEAAVVRDEWLYLQEKELGLG
ncbi:MAG: UvrB/UvrC motif-containing protein, partial [Candidatus Euphemobacter frigidus]|nr:UvrB/UvrC motif-containing protein [Candidatus Euphemobacter frigidus]